MQRPSLVALGLVIVTATAVLGAAAPSRPAKPSASEAAAAAPAMSPAALASIVSRLDAYVAEEMRRQRIPGVALALTDRERTLRVVTYGYANLDARTRVMPETLFEIGSISKSFTTFALMQERDAGRFDPRAPISKYVPFVPIQSSFAPITGHHLLSHTAGLPAYSRDDVPSSPFLALAGGVAGAPPGAHFVYSNLGFQIVSAMLESIAGKPYPEIIRTRLLEPLGMTSTEPVITHATRPRLAVGYESYYDDRPTPAGGPVAPATWLEYGVGDGSIASTAGDMAIYVRLLLNRGAGPRGRIVAPQTFDLMTQKVAPMEQDDPGEGGWYGYGLIVADGDGGPVLRHSGGMVGYSAMMVADLPAGLGVIVLTNGPARPAGIADHALDLARAAQRGRPLPPSPPPEPTAAGAEAAAACAGVYTAAAGGRTLTFEAHDGELVLLHKGARLVLERRGDDEYLADHPDFALFLLRFGREGGKGPAVEVFHGGDWHVHARYHGPREFQAPPEWTSYPGHYRTANPWFSNFRVVLRKGRLALIHPSGEEEAIVPLQGGLFRVGDDARSAERLTFDSPFDGKATRATLSGVDYYRTFTP